MSDAEQADGMIHIILYEEEVSGARWPEKVNTRGPRAVTWHHVHVAELKETAQAPPPYQHFLTTLNLWPRWALCIYSAYTNNFCLEFKALNKLIL